MADKKIKKITAEKITNPMADLRAKSMEELQKLLQTARADLLQAQKSLRANELANPRVVRKMRREIARILFVINEQELESSKVRKSESSNKGTSKPANLRTSKLIEEEEKL